jgi:hypothetical protein
VPALVLAPLPVTVPVLKHWRLTPRLRAASAAAAPKAVLFCFVLFCLSVRMYLRGFFRT